MTLLKKRCPIAPNSSLLITFFTFFPQDKDTTKTEGKDATGKQGCKLKNEMCLLC